MKQTVYVFFTTTLSIIFAFENMYKAQMSNINSTQRIIQLDNAKSSQGKSWWMNTGLSFHSRPPTSYRRAWCPDVQCKSPKLRNDIEPDLCQQKWIFIFSTGRSGSTSILETLNAISWPKSDVSVRLRGEHEGAMTDMVNYVERAFTERSTGKDFIFKPGQSYNLKQKLILYQIQRLFADTNPPGPVDQTNSSSSEHTGRDDRMPLVGDDNHTILGFKEIRYNDDRHVHFIKAAFPCSRIIFNYRLDVLAQRESGFYKKFATVEELQAKNKDILRLSQLYPSTSFRLPLEKLQPATFTQLLRWLGFRHCEVTALCHSNAEGYSKKPCNTQDMVRGPCKMVEPDEAVL